MQVNYWPKFTIKIILVLKNTKRAVKYLHNIKA